MARILVWQRLASPDTDIISGGCTATRLWHRERLPTGPIAMRPTDGPFKNFVRHHAARGWTVRWPTRQQLAGDGLVFLSPWRGGLSILTGKRLRFLIRWNV